jgi:hypothetical protein
MTRSGEVRNVQTILVRKFLGKRPVGTSTMGWKDIIIKGDMLRMGG